MRHKLFTIIICTYNGESVLSKAIESVLKQEDYDVLVDKFVIVDNNSKDRTKEIIKSYCQIKNNVVYTFERKPGLSNARLKGVNETQSEWIVFVDDDNELQNQWLIKAEEFIKANSSIGAFNGAVIPKFNFDLSDMQEDVLRVIYKGLACTHLAVEDININQTEHPNLRPFGAGLVIRSSCLKDLAEEGWLNLTGRTGANLAAGEDGEMCDYVQKQGYKMGYNGRMLLYHIIPSFRLTEDYVINLYKGFAHSTYLAANYKSLYILRRLKYFLISARKIVKNKILIKNCTNNVTRIRLRIGIETSKTLIMCIFKDYLVLKRHYK